MNTIKHQITATLVATAFAVSFASGCGTEAGSEPAEIGVGQEPAPPKPEFHGSPDSIDRPRTTLPSKGATACEFSADAAERLGRPPCAG